MELTELVLQWGLALVLASAFVEQLGLPFPSYPVLMVAGALSFTSGESLILIVAAGSAGAVMADLLVYAAGARFGGHALLLVCKVGLASESWVHRTEEKFTHAGAWALLFAKFVPGFALVLIVLCGVTRLALPVFLLLDAIGAIAYIALAVVLGALFHDAIDSILATVSSWEGYVVALLIGALALFILFKWSERQHFIRRLKIARISVRDLAHMIDAGGTPIILDVRPAGLRARDGIIPGSIGASADEIALVSARYARDAEIIIYCSCPNEATAATAAMHLKRAGFKNIRPLAGGIDAWAEAGSPIEGATRAFAELRYSAG